MLLVLILTVLFVLWTMRVELASDYIDRQLRFRGRIDREQWIRQAEVLVAGGEAEYIRVFGKPPR